MIRRLAPHTVQQIAAGEVIERPASALKELLENSIDAGAHKIKVTYEGGGLDYLEVEDDGLGILESDLPLVFEAHATSKISTIDDLESLGSFGFRGEALSALATIAEVDLWTSSSQESFGHRVHIAFNGELKIQAADKRIGTQMIAKHLFRQMPARHKFMKSPRSESLALMQVVRRYVLAYPEYHFECLDRASGRHLKWSKSSALLRVMEYFHSENEERWASLASASAEWKLQFYYVKPSFVGETKSGILLFFKKRPIKDSRLEFAVKRAFENYSDRPKDLSAVLFLDGPSSEVDVNVHPRKNEVQFRDFDQVQRFVVTSIRDQLKTDHFVPQSFSTNPQSSIDNAFIFKPEIKTPQNIQAQINFVSAPEKMTRYSLSDGSSEDFSSRSAPDTSISTPPTNELTSPSMLSSQNPVFEDRSFSEEKRRSNHEALFEYMGSLDQTYLLVKKEQELFIFDQHALHERILYEDLLQSAKIKGQIDAQRLLFPVPLMMKGAEFVLEREDFFLKLGFEFRLWNDSKVQMIAAPACLKRGHQEVLSKLLECQAAPEEMIFSEILSSIACHSAVRAHDAVSDAQATYLIESFFNLESVGYCPHGRPTFYRLDVKELEKIFHRVLS